MLGVLRTSSVDSNVIHKDDCWNRRLVRRMQMGEIVFIYRSWFW